MLAKLGFMRRRHAEAVLKMDGKRTYQQLEDFLSLRWTRGIVATDHIDRVVGFALVDFSGNEFSLVKLAARTEGLRKMLLEHVRHLNRTYYGRDSIAAYVPMEDRESIDFFKKNGWEHELAKENDAIRLYPCID